MSKANPLTVVKNSDAYGQLCMLDEAEGIIQDLEICALADNHQIDQLKTELGTALEYLSRLEKKVAILESGLTLISFGGLDKVGLVYKANETLKAAKEIG